MIPDEAVEAAACAFVEVDPLWPDGAWEGMSEESREDVRGIVGAIIEAAAPHMLIHVHHHDIEKHAESFNEGYETAMAQELADDPTTAQDWLDGKLAEAWDEGWDTFASFDSRPGGPYPSNPYRPTDAGPCRQGGWRPDNRRPGNHAARTSRDAKGRTHAEPERPAARHQVIPAEAVEAAARAIYGNRAREWSIMERMACESQARRALKAAAPYGMHVHGIEGAQVIPDNAVEAALAEAPRLARYHIGNARMRRILEAAAQHLMGSVSALEELTLLEPGSVLQGPDFHGETYKCTAPGTFHAIASPTEYRPSELVGRGPFKIIYREPRNAV